MSTAYIETTIPSYYAARSARSVLQASRQIVTQELWDGGCSGFDLVTSTETLNESGEGDPEMANDFKHIANPYIRERMRATINDLGFRTPVMCSPEELLNDDEGV